MGAGEGAARWEGSGAGCVQGGPCLAEPVSQESPALCQRCRCSGCAGGVSRVPLSGQSGRPPGSPHSRRAAPNPFPAKSSSPAATSSSGCAVYGSRPALPRQASAQPRSSPGWDGDSPLRALCSLSLRWGLCLLGPGNARMGAVPALSSPLGTQYAQPWGHGGLRAGVCSGWGR